MCSNGVNTNQLKDTIVQIDETVALTRRWTHRMYHLAKDGSMPKTTEKLEEVQRMLDDVRALLDEAGDAVDDDDSNINNVTVELA